MKIMKYYTHESCHKLPLQAVNRKPLKTFIFYSEKPLKTFICHDKPLFSGKAFFSNLLYRVLPIKMYTWEKF